MHTIQCAPLNPERTTYRNKNKTYWISKQTVQLVNLRAVNLEDQVINKFQGNIIKIEKDK